MIRLKFHPDLARHLYTRYTPKDFRPNQIQWVSEETLQTCTQSSPASRPKINRTYRHLVLSTPLFPGATCPVNRSTTPCKTCLLNERYSIVFIGIYLTITEIAFLWFSRRTQGQPRYRSLLNSSYDPTLFKITTNPRIIWSEYRHS